MSSGPDSIARDRGRELVALFHHQSNFFGELVPVSSGEVVSAARQLLDHSSHMTVAMERFYRGPVSLKVVNRTDCPDGRYAREILLRLDSGRIVQQGIVRVDLRILPPETAAAIRAESAPLGRILLDAGLLCDVHDVHLLRIVVGPHLARLFEISRGTEAFGRVATIGLAGLPAIELLEIAAPVAN
jgi:hypothetical protein